MSSAPSGRPGAAPADPEPRPDAGNPDGGSEPRLRRDAARNRLRILEAAGTVFAERGLDASVEDIAAAAGVGIGTLYRRFGDKEQLIDALFEHSLDGLLELAEEAAEATDPWEALVGFLRSVQELLVANRALAQLTHSSAHGRDRVAECRARLFEPVERLVRRARDQGALRPEVEAADVAMVTVMLGAVADYTEAIVPGVWRRYLGLLLDGLRAPGRPSEPLPVGPLQRQDLDRAMDAWRPVNR